MGFVVRGLRKSVRSSRGFAIGVVDLGFRDDESGIRDGVLQFRVQDFGHNVLGVRAQCSIKD